ncbi:hypothetical protein AB0D37_35060 [Streptomyces sp. NPDC048384]|uniref:hypothetical protein n=1 Tax=Streptomyces sp. NPDC048384 TaxID=3155487 RepID=UPI0034271DE0
MGLGPDIAARAEGVGAAMSRSLKTPVAIGSGSDLFGGSTWCHGLALVLKAGLLGLMGAGTRCAVLPPP